MKHRKSSFEKSGEIAKVSENLKITKLISDVCLGYQIKKKSRLVYVCTTNIIKLNYIYSFILVKLQNKQFTAISS